MKKTYIAITVAVVLVLVALILSMQGTGEVNTQDGVLAGGVSSNVVIVDGKQIIEITAKGGYKPGKSIAKAGMPTVVRVKTNGTFDCSSFIRIPSLNVSQSLPQTGVTDIDAGTSTVGVLQGTCGMGMYSFDIEFRS